MPALQVLVDVSTPAEVFQQVDLAVTEHFKANPKEYTGEKLVVANNATDPLKFTLCVFWEYSHPGAVVSNDLFVMIQDAHHNHANPLQLAWQSHQILIEPAL